MKFQKYLISSCRHSHKFYYVGGIRHIKFHISTGDPLHSRSACTQPCNVNTHSRAHCSLAARLCEQWGHGCVNNGARLCASARLCRGSPVISQICESKTNSGYFESWGLQVCFHQQSLTLLVFFYFPGRMTSHNSSIILIWSWNMCCVFKIMFPKPFIFKSFLFEDKGQPKLLMTTLLETIFENIYFHWFFLHITFFLWFMFCHSLTHWGRVTHICVGINTNIGSDNGLSPGRRQAIIWTNAELLLIGPPGTNVSGILSEIHTFSFKKMHFKTSSAKWRPSCLGLNVLRHHIYFTLQHSVCVTELTWAYRHDSLTIIATITTLHGWGDNSLIHRF